MGSIADNLQAVIGRIAKAAELAARSPGAVSLLAVSKTWPASAVQQAAQAGQTAFGENYVQEGVDKIEALNVAGLHHLSWHFIGPLQSNKSRLVAEHFDWVHSVDRLKIAERLSAQRPAGKPALNVCIQVNISGEASKSGCLPEETLALARGFDRVLYISCNPQTLRDNVMALQDTHQISAAAAFDQFPYTHHLEAGLLLTRRQGASASS